jgi:anti-sigma regulatory factor (Ser/Thr protein kinase)
MAGSAEPSSACEEPSDATDQDASATVPARTGSVPATRAFLVNLLKGWDIAVDTIDDAALLVTELVTNAIEHGAGMVAIEVCIMDGVLHVAVSDRGRWVPHQAEADPEAEHGRGLWLVEAVSSDWGRTPQDGGDGKTVWFDLRVVA